MSLNGQISPGTRRSFIKNTAGLATALLSARTATARTSSTVAVPGGPANMINEMTFEDVRKLLDLSPNATCGYVRVTFVSKHKIAAGGMQAPFADGRPAGSALYFMLTPEEPVKLHRIRNDQLYHYYLGDPIEVLMLLESGFAERHIVGPDLRKGHRVQAVYPGQHIPHRARDRRAALVSRRLDRMARRRACGCRARQPGCAGGQISRRRCRDSELSGASEAIRPGLRRQRLLQVIENAMPFASEEAYGT
jgi:predicted cupin superfamily sugar epimerase